MAKRRSICGITGCINVHCAYGYCKYHYTAWNKEGRPDRGIWIPMCRKSTCSSREQYRYGRCRQHDEEHTLELNIPDNTEISCSIATCDTVGGVKGLCPKHYQQWYRDKRPSLKRWIQNHTPRIKQKRKEKCRTGCGRANHTHGFCKTHVNRWAKAGRPDPETWDPGPIILYKKKKRK
jgi:hypothetical protein